MSVQFEQQFFKLEHRRFGRIEIAGLTGAEIIVAIGIGDGRGAAVDVDQTHQLLAQLARQEAGQGEHLDPRIRQAPDTGIGAQLVEDGIAGIGHAPDDSFAAPPIKPGNNLARGEMPRSFCFVLRGVCARGSRLRGKWVDPFAKVPECTHPGMCAWHMAIVAQLVRAPVCGTGGRGFNPRRSPHFPAIPAALEQIEQGRQDGGILDRSGL